MNLKIDKMNFKIDKMNFKIDKMNFKIEQNEFQDWQITGNCYFKATPYKDSFLRIQDLYSNT